MSQSLLMTIMMLVMIMVVAVVEVVATEADSPFDWMS